MRRKFPKIIYLLVCFLLILEQSGFAQVAGQLDISGYFTGLRNVLIQDKFRPLHLRYLSYDNTNNNLKLILDKGDLKPPQNQELENSTKELLNYFFVGISLPNDSFWVNLRPDSSGNIIDDYLVQTDVGKILLEADLQLKKDTAAFTSPQTIEGKKYWDSLYKKAGELFGSENITIPTLTRPWIVPGEIIIRETQENAYVYKATLKVMLEQDYLKESATYNFSDERSKQLNEYASELIRETIIPKLTKDVNTAKRYAPLRQVYYSLILAQWFKQKFSGKSGLYSQLINKRNLNGLTSKEAWSKDTYFQAYQKSFKEGEYNIKEQVYTLQGQTIRNYMSGGIAIGGNVSEAINAGLRIPGNQKQAITLTSQIAGQLRPGIPQAPYSGELSIQSFTEKPIESASSPVEMEPGMVPKTIEIEGLKFYTNAALPAGAVGLNLSLEPGAGYPDLLIYGFPTPDGHIALNGGIINPANYALKEKNLLRPLLRKFFEFYPQVDRTSESFMIPVMVKILIQDFGFQPKDGVRPNAWMGEPVSGKSDLYLTEEAWNLSFGKDGVKGLLPATSASMHIFNRVSDDFNGRDLNGKVLFPLYLGKGHALYRQPSGSASSPVDSVFTQDDRLNLSALQQILQAAIPEALRENVKPKIFGSAAYLADKGFIELAAIDDVDIGHELHGETKIRFSHKNYAENLRNIFSQAWGEKRVTGIESFALPHDFEGMETFSHYYFYITSVQGYRLKITVPPSTSTDMAGFVAQDVATIVKTPEYRLDKPIKRNLLLVAYLGGYLKETPTIDTLRAEYIGIIHLLEGSGRNNALKQFELKLSAIAARLKERYRNEIVGQEAELSGLTNFIRRKLDAAIIISPLGRSESASSSPITIEQIRSKVAKDSEEILIDVLTTPNAKGGRQPRTVWFDYDKRLLITVFDVENEQFRRQLQQSVLNKSISGSEGLRNIINGIMGQPESAFIALNRYIIEVNNLDRLRGESGIVTRRQTRIRLLEDLKNSLIPLAMVSIINGRLSRSKSNTRGQVEIQFNPKDLPYVKQALELLPGLDAGILESASILVIQVEPMAGASSPIKTKQDGSRVKEDRDSSLMVETKDVKGGIDFRTMPASIQRVSNLPLGNVPVAMPLASINLDESLGQIQNMLKAGIIPSSERIREYLQSCCRKKDMGQDIDKILACIADILRLQEDRATSTDLSLKEMLALLESNKSASEMQFVLAKITVAEKESLEIAR